MTVTWCWINSIEDESQAGQALVALRCSRKWRTIAVLPSAKKRYRTLELPRTRQDRRLDATNGRTVLIQEYAGRCGSKPNRIAIPSDYPGASVVYRPGPSTRPARHGPVDLSSQNTLVCRPSSTSRICEIRNCIPINSWTKGRIEELNVGDVAGEADKFADAKRFGF